MTKIRIQSFLLPILFGLILFCLLFFTNNSVSNKAFAQEAEFDPHHVISDYQLTDHTSMTLEQIQLFLEEAGGTLGDYLAVDMDGKKKRASEIIYRASQDYQINPQILITLLQREKSLITKSSTLITQDDYNWATGFSCYDYSNPVSRFRGFASQVDRAAWRLRYYIEHPWQFKFEVGQKSKTLSNWNDRWLINRFGRYIAPVNQATAGLYNYAPHLYDNWLFWKIWQKWFANLDHDYPDGSLLRADGEAGVWLIQNGERRAFKSKNVFLLSYSFDKVQVVEKWALEKYLIGKPMSFPQYSLVQAPGQQIYMLIDGKKRAITQEMFKRIGYHSSEVIEVEENELDSYFAGAPILSPYPNGALLQNSETKSVYYVEENIKYPIVDISILNANYPYASITKVSPEELNQFATSKPAKLKDGSLIKSIKEAAVYVISQGQRLPIYSGEVFEALGYQWDAIQTVPIPVLAMHPLNETIVLE